MKILRTALLITVLICSLKSVQSQSIDELQLQFYKDFESKNLEAALNTANQMLKTDSLSWKTYLALAQINYTLYNFAGSQTYIEKGIELNPNEPKFYLYRARILSNMR